MGYRRGAKGFDTIALSSSGIDSTTVAAAATAATATAGARSVRQPQGVSRPRRHSSLTGLAGIDFPAETTIASHGRTPAARLRDEFAMLDRKSSELSARLEGFGTRRRMSQYGRCPHPSVGASSSNPGVDANSSTSEVIIGHVPSTTSGKLSECASANVPSDPAAATSWSDLANTIPSLLAGAGSRLELSPLGGLDKAEVIAIIVAGVTELDFAAAMEQQAGGADVDVAARREEATKRTVWILQSLLRGLPDSARKLVLGKEQEEESTKLKLISAKAAKQQQQRSNKKAPKKKGNEKKKTKKTKKTTTKNKSKKKIIKKTKIKTKKGAETTTNHQAIKPVVILTEKDAAKLRSTRIRKAAEDAAREKAQAKARRGRREQTALATDEQQHHHHHQEQQQQQQQKEEHDGERGEEEVHLKKKHGGVFASGWEGARSLLTSFLFGQREKKVEEMAKDLRLLKSKQEKQKQKSKRRGGRTVTSVAPSSTSSPRAGESVDNSSGYVPSSRYRSGSFRNGGDSAARATRKKTSHGSSHSKQSFFDFMTFDPATATEDGWKHW